MHLEFIEEHEPNDVGVSTPVQVKLLRGMFYVHLYAALEKTVNETVEQSLLVIKNDNVLNRHYKTEFNVVSLHPKMQGFKAAGHKNFFGKSIEVFSSVDTEEAVVINNTIFATNLQNIWYKVLDQVLKCFGLPGFPVDPRLRHVIDEVVDKRNAIAHGRDSPVAMGERHRSDVLRQRTSDIQIVADLFIGALEEFVSNKEYVKPHYRAVYCP